jgi:hypothetical protein
VNSLTTWIALFINAFVICASCLAQPAGGRGADEGPGQPQALFVASDFSRLAQGVDPGIDGEATVSVWAPSEEEWRLESAGAVLTLHYTKKAGDTQPRWQALGKVKLSAGTPLKIFVSGGNRGAGKQSAVDVEAKDAARDTAKAKEQRKDRATSKAAPDASQDLPVPALLWLARGTSSGEEPVMDLVRGRLDAREPLHDLRRTQIRMNSQGAEFQAPSSAAAWRDRAKHLREQMLVTLGRCFRRRL